MVWYCLKIDPYTVTLPKVWSIHRNLLKTTGAVRLLFVFSGNLHPRYHNTVLIRHPIVWFYMYTNRKETLKNVEHLVVGEELIRLKNLTNGTLDREERRKFWDQWKADNYALLVNQLGYKTQQSRFFHGVVFTPSFTKTTVPHLLTILGQTQALRSRNRTGDEEKA